MELVQTICVGREPQDTQHISPINTNGLADAMSRYSPALYQIAFRKLGNVEDAQDAVQDALLLAFKNIHQFRGESQFSTWLYSIVLNTARMQLRRRLNHKLVSLDVSDKKNEDGKPIWAEQLEDSAPDAEETFRQTQSRERLERIVEMLPFRLRLAFRLRAFDGLSTKEAATALGIPKGTLKTRFSRARTRVIAQVRQALESPRKHRSTFSR